LLLLALVLAAITNDASAEVLRGLHDSATEYVTSLADDEDEEAASASDAKEDEEDAEEKEKEPDDAKADESNDIEVDEKSDRKTHTVKASPLKIELEVDSKFVARNTAEVKLEPE